MASNPVPPQSPPPPFSCTYTPNIPELFGLQSSADGYYFPQFADLDNDGDFDLVATGYFYGDGSTVFYFENTGSPQAPNFAVPVSDPFGISLSETYITSITSGDLDNDGDVDLLIGKYDDAALFYFENTGTPESPGFAGPVQNPFNLQPTGNFSVPLLLDLDDDGDADLLSFTYQYDAAAGDGRNQFYYFENSTVVDVQTEALQEAAFRLFPTVTKSTINWHLEDPSATPLLQLAVLNANGQLLRQWSTADQNGSLEVGNLARGRYYFQFRDRKGKVLAVRTFIKQ